VRARPETYADQVGAWLRADPAITSAELLQRAREAGYSGGKPAFYELVRRVKAARRETP
jgi:hypothetical protein